MGMKRSRLGSLDVTSFGLGSAPLGGLFAPVSDADAEATFAAGWSAGIRFYDTAPLYGFGLAERRLGAFLRQQPRESYVVSTKVGRLLRAPDGAAAEDDYYKSGQRERPVFDFSHDGVMRSVEESLARLGLDRVDVLLVHDPDDHYDEAVAGAFRALQRLRSEGTVKAIGAGMNQSDMLVRFAAAVPVDCFLLAGATHCSTRARWMRCSRSAPRRTSASCSAASTTAASWPIRTRARSSTIRMPMRHSSPVRSHSTSSAASTAPS